MIRVGTCSWADDSFVQAYYPAGVDRLRYYSDRFDVVEANSTYYRLPDEALVARWADKLPDGFVMHVKAFGLMTRHPVKVGALPEDLRGEAPVDDRGRVDRPPGELREEVFRRFVTALEPLRKAGKLGGVLMQMAPYVVPKQSSYDYLAWAREQLGSHTMLVEFRHRSWFEQADQTLGFLESNGMTYVTVDSPVFPVVVARTGPDAYVRFHGRNRDTWYKRTGSTAERFDYLYSETELADWACTLRELADEGAENVYAMFNNNGRSAAADAPRHGVGGPFGRIRRAGADERRHPEVAAGARLSRRAASAADGRRPGRAHQGRLPRLEPGRTERVALCAAAARLRRAALVRASDGRTARWRHAELTSQERRIPLTTNRCRRRRSTIPSSKARSQYGPSALFIAVHPQRDAVRVAPGGELDLANAGALEAQLDELRGAGFKHVVLDLRELTFMDSSGVRLILEEDRLARSTGRRLSLIKGPPAVQRALDICGLSQQLDFGEAAPTPSLARAVRDRPTEPDRPALGIAFQSYLAQLRQQGRASSRLSRPTGR